MNPRCIQSLAWALALVCVPPSTTAFAATAAMTTTVERVLASEEGRFGGCMVRLAEGINSATGLNCSRDWATFSCSGDHTSKSSAMRMFDSAQLAFVSGRGVVVELDDARKHDGFCFVQRIDVLE